MFCTADRCPVIVGNNLVYPRRQSRHDRIRTGARAVLGAIAACSGQALRSLPGNEVRCGRHDVGGGVFLHVVARAFEQDSAMPPEEGFASFALRFAEREVFRGPHHQCGSVGESGQRRGSLCQKRSAA